MDYYFLGIIAFIVIVTLIVALIYVAYLHDELKEHIRDLELALKERR